MIELHGIHVILSAIILGVMTAIWFAMDLWRDGNAGFKQEEEREHRDQRRHQNRRRGDQRRQGEAGRGSASRDTRTSPRSLRRDPAESGIDLDDGAKAAGLDVTLGVQDLTGLLLYGTQIRVDGELHSCSVMTESAEVAAISAVQTTMLCLHRDDIDLDDCETVILFGLPGEESYRLESGWQCDLQSRGVIPLDLEKSLGDLLPSAS